MDFIFKLNETNANALLSSIKLAGSAINNLYNELENQGREQTLAAMKQAKEQDQPIKKDRKRGKD